MADAFLGMLLVDKPVGPTSHVVLRRLSRSLGCKRAGNLGTLDPFASGLLPIFLGRATRLADELHGTTKQYLFTIQLGTTTDTLDSQGQVTITRVVPELSWEHFQSVVPQFLGSIDQTPPLYSALKMNGRPLYEYMRAQGSLPQDIETKRRKVEVFSLDVLSYEAPIHQVTCRVRCGPGTYIRSLARDMALAVGTVGHCLHLRREAIGPWSVEDALPFSLDPAWDAAEVLAQKSNAFLSLPHILPQVPWVVLPEGAHTSFFVAGNPIRVKPADLQLPEHGLTLGSIFLEAKEHGVIFLCDVQLGLLAENSAENESIFHIKPKKRLL